MVEKLISRLYKRGWERDEILGALNIIKKAKQNKHPHIKIMDKFVYWILLLVIIVLNFGIATAFIPSMLSFTWPFLFLIVGTIGYVFGLMLEIVIRSIEHLETKHHIALGLIIPIIAILNIVLIGSTPNSIQQTLSFGYSHNLYLVGFVYSIALVTPYFIFKVILKKGYYSGV